MFRHGLGLFALFLLIFLTPVRLSILPVISCVGSSESSSTLSAHPRRYLSERQISVNFGFDVLSVAKAVSGSASAAVNRGAFVKNLA